MVNSVLLEHGHEEYRNKLARLGLPVYDVQEMVSNLDNVDNGAEGLLFTTGQKSLLNIFSQISCQKMWLILTYLEIFTLLILVFGPMIPDTIFVNIKELIDDGIDLGGKYLDVSRIPIIKTT